MGSLLQCQPTIVHGECQAAVVHAAAVFVPAVACVVDQERYGG
jgi:hypothetical protein